MLRQKTLDRPHFFYLRAVKVRAFRRLLRNFHPLQIQQQFQNFGAEIGKTDRLRHLIHFAEEMLYQRSVVEYSRVLAQFEFFEDLVGLNLKVFQFRPQGFPCRRQFQPHRQAVIVPCGKNEPPRVMQSAIQLHVSRTHIGHGVLRRRVFHPPFPAMVDGQQISRRDKPGIEVFHMKIIVMERDPRENGIGGHCSVAGFVAELPHGAFVVLCHQQCAGLLCQQVVQHTFLLLSLS